MTILDEIRAHKEREVAEREGRRSLDDVLRECDSAPPPRSLSSALRRPGTQVIAEVKRRSPAKGDLAPHADASIVAQRYVNGGAAAVSVLTDERFFSGSDADLRAVRARIDAPILRKDFVITAYQVSEARALGADAVLLIVAMLSDEQLARLMEAARDLEMDALVETHTEEEVRRAVALDAAIIGINNRDLATFRVDLRTTERLRPLIPDEALVVSESGITRRADVERVVAAGAHAVLVGEALVTAADPAAKLAELLGHVSVTAAFP
ncbi:MAG TPA: indole-3-glycerol phosphate synthase TrpC [Chloroflexota bacterium]|nr:indole-3-glycerol phosphate synthase TrpC [Chloroflexota bacterium]